ncbi:MAG TPA: alpha/beta hydrolase [Vitreimonas sp.]|uniref:alpha/beta fold hydrolase n=1 Tax=Vitreimonas sp. TaxID=3069702 RepID=UPI002D433EF2|nr:alpha/beta hydrolase [Vitreimonas sp.]HYD86357.1 alpha/beta hydrolase [Vitreimonas sp.]
MERRGFLAMLAATLLAACASTAETPQPQAFSSDRITVVTRGAGPDVIFIPGLTSHRDVWADTATALEGRYRVHLVQLNGFAGFPAEGNAEGPVAAPVAEEIARYIAEQGLERPAVIGHSMGGTMGMMLAARHPQRVGKLMVVDMIPWMGAMFGPPGSTAESVRPVADQIRAQMLAAPADQTSTSEEMIAGMIRTESARAQHAEYARISDRRTVANAFHELIVTDLRPELANITAPVRVLFVIPPNAPITPEQYEAYTRMSYQNLPQAEIVKVEDAWHFIMIDARERFIADVEAFLAE